MVHGHVQPIICRIDLQSPYASIDECQQNRRGAIGGARVDVDRLHRGHPHFIGCIEELVREVERLPIRAQLDITDAVGVGPGEEDQRGSWHDVAVINLEFQQPDL